MVPRDAPDPRPFLAACETCGARRPWPTHAEAVADAGRHQQAHLGHRARAPHPVLNAELLLQLAVLIVVLALLVLLFVPRLYPSTLFDFRLRHTTPRALSPAPPL